MQFSLLWIIDRVNGSFTKDFNPILRIASYLIVIHGPNGLINILQIKQWAILKDDLIDILKVLLIEVTRNFRLAQNNNIAGRKTSNPILLLLGALIKQPLARLHHIIMIENISPKALLMREITIKTLVQLGYGFGV